MTHRQLIFFYKVYENKNIVHVAEEMYISPQGISKTILQLEKEFGVKLFERSGNKMLPTPSADKLISHVKTILDEYSVISEKSFYEEDAKKTVRILATYDSLKKIPTSFFKDFSAIYPNILLHFDEMPDVDIIKQINKHEAELALLPGPFEHNDYDSTLFFTSKFCYLINKQNPLSQKQQLCFEDLRDQPLAVKSTNHPLSQHHINIFAKEGINPNIFIEICDSEIIKRMAEENLAVGMTLDYLVPKADPNKVVTIFSQYFEKTIYLVSQKNSQLSREAELFKNMILPYLKKDSPT